MLVGLREKEETPLEDGAPRSVSDVWLVRVAGTRWFGPAARAVYPDHLASSLRQYRGLPLTVQLADAFPRADDTKSARLLQKQAGRVVLKSRAL